MRRIILISFALVLACWTQSVVADPVANSADARTSLAMEILTVTDAKQRLMTMVDLMEPSMLKLIGEAHPSLSEKALDALRVALHEEMQAGLNDLMGQLAQIYVRHFTDDEMRTVLAFYRTDTGKKLLAEMPAITKESAALGAAWGQQVGVAAGQRALARLKSEGYKI